ncbi:MAG: PIN domain-containing protein [Candidatus Nanopelagicales bacterium]|nr:PIN domain-containing protein [Candidatus Nanopelagicales bacterium]
MSGRVALDSWAILNLLDDGPNAATVEAAVDSGDSVMSWINLGEVAYILTRRQSEDAADVVVADVRSSVDVQLPDAPLVLAAAKIKAGMPMAYADAFAAATALRYDVPLMTGDPELLVRPKKSTKIRAWRWVDLR